MHAGQRAILRVFVSVRTEQHEVVNFADELAAARKAMSTFEIKGMDLSKALRSAGFNRAYELNGRKATDIIYKRTDAPIDQGQSARRDYDATERDMIRRGKEAEAKVHWHKRTGK